MTYSPKYVTIDYIEGLLGRNTPIDANTVPSQDDVLRYIEEEERDVDYNKLWGSIVVNDEIIDVDAKNKPPLNMLAHDAFRYFSMNSVVVTPKYPSFTEVIKLEVNTAGDTETPVWEERDGWPISDADYEIIKHRIHDKDVGYAIRFRQNSPKTGNNRVRLTYKVGLGLSDKMIREYLGHLIAVRVTEVMAQSNLDMDLSEGADRARYMNLKAGVKRAEEKLPKINKSVSVIVQFKQNGNVRQDSDSELTDRIPQIKDTKDATQYIIAEATVSTSDTVTINALTDISTAVVYEFDGTSVSTTVATNVITITQASLTDVKVVILAFE